jgi:hypothetical protein
MDYRAVNRTKTIHEVPVRSKLGIDDARGSIAEILFAIQHPLDDVIIDSISMREVMKFR